MQYRQRNRALYFEELAITSRKYFVPYISKFKEIRQQKSVLEIGCGDGGNLLPFAELGCKTIGVDLSETRIKDAKFFFQERGMKGVFMWDNIFNIDSFIERFDIIICHDVFEHIYDKDLFLKQLRKYITDDGIIFMSFPAWQMPFGGHQQICKNKLLAHLPFIHLLPNILYKYVLNKFGENKDCINELLSIKKTRLSIETFESLLQKEGIQIIDKQLYFINPHYEIKFRLRPRKLYYFISKIPYVRNFFTTSCFYILSFANMNCEKCCKN